MKTFALSANLAISLFGVFILCLLALHGLRPDYTPVDHMISDYAVGRFGMVMTVAFVCLSLGCLSLAVGLWQAGPKSILTRIGCGLLIVTGVGLLVTATFPTDIEGAPDTQHGMIHTLSFQVNIISIMLSAIFTSLGFDKAPEWRSLRPAAMILAALLLAAFVIQILTLHRGAPYGIANRVFVAVILIWLLTLTFRLRAVTSQPAALA